MAPIRYSLKYVRICSNKKAEISSISAFQVETEGFEPSSRTGKPCAFYMLIPRLIVGFG